MSHYPDWRVKAELQAQLAGRKIVLKYQIFEVRRLKQERSQGCLKLLVANVAPVKTQEKTWLCVYRDVSADSCHCISLHVTQRRSGTCPRVAPVETLTASKLLPAAAAISISGSI